MVPRGTFCGCRTHVSRPRGAVSRRRRRRRRDDDDDARHERRRGGRRRRVRRGRGRGDGVEPAREG